MGKGLSGLNVGRSAYFSGVMILSLSAAMLANAQDPASDRSAPATTARVLASMSATNDSSARVQDAHLSKLLAEALQQHPSVIAEQLQKKASQEDLEGAKMQRWPNLSVQTETSGHKPNTTLAVQVPLWNWGKTDASIGAASQAVEAQSAKIREAELIVAFRVLESWQSARAAQKRLAVQADTRKKLEGFNAMMERRISAQVSPTIEAEVVGARLRQIEADEEQTQSVVLQSLSRLGQLLGRKVDASEIGAEAHRVNFQGRFQSALESKAPENYPSIERAKREAAVALQEAKIKDASRYPEVFFRWFKSTSRNGPSEHGGFVGLKVETGAGLSSLNLARSAAARAEAAAKAIDLARRDLMDQIETDQESLRNAAQRSHRLEKAISSAAQVLDSYERLFVAGRRSWQEVLNAVREHHDFRVAQTDADSEAQLNWWRLQLRTSNNLKGDFIGSR